MPQLEKMCETLEELAAQVEKKKLVGRRHHPWMAKVQHDPQRLPAVPDEHAKLPVHAG